MAEGDDRPLIGVEASSFRAFGLGAVGLGGDKVSLFSASGRQAGQKMLIHFRPWKSAMNRDLSDVLSADGR